MKSLILNALSIPVFRNIIDIIIALVATPCAIILRTYRRIGSGKLPLTTKVLKLIGLFPITDHYYEPLFNDKALIAPLSNDRNLPGINMNILGQLDFIESLNFASELIALELHKSTDKSDMFYFGNGSFESGDAEFLYQFIRTVRPNKIIEIGSGYSTRIARLALRRNRLETGCSVRHVCIEPYEMQWLEELDGINILRKRVEDCDVLWTSELASGDLLFIDSSHIIRPQGDVIKEYLEILPQLSAGVYVHIHDIFTPKDYLHDWIVNHVRFWNEQYLLEALLSNSERYEIVAALNYLKHHHYDKLKNICPYLTSEREPVSFYIRIR